MHHTKQSNLSKSWNTKWIDFYYWYSIKNYIIKEIFKCGPLSILIDETSDLSNKE